MSRRITAKVRCTSTNKLADCVRLDFQPDYQDDRNKEWAYFTPSLSLGMTVRPEVADQWGVEVGKTYTLTFDETD